MQTDPWTARAASSSLPELSAAIEHEVMQANWEAVETGALGRANLLRTVTVVQHVERTLSAADPRLVSETVWSVAEQRATQIRDAVVALRQDGNLGHLQTVQTVTDQLIEGIAAIPPAPNGRRSRDSQQASRAFLRSLDQYTVSAEELAEQLQADVAALESRSQESMANFATELDSKADAVLARVQEAEARVTQANERLDAAVSKFQTDVADERQRLTTLNSDWNARLTTTNSKATQEWAEIKDSTVAENLALRRELESDWSVRLEGLEASVRERLEYFDAQYDRVNQILGVTAASSAAGSFMQEAVEQRHEANFWRWGAVGAWVVAIGLGAWSAHDVVANVEGLTTPELTALAAVRTAFAGLVLTAAVWVSRQGAHHRERELTARKLASELTAFRPFIAELDPEARSNQVKAASERFFPGPPESSSDRPR